MKIKIMEYHIKKHEIRGLIFINGSLSFFLPKRLLGKALMYQEVIYSFKCTVSLSFQKRWNYELKVEINVHHF